MMVRIDATPAIVKVLHDVMPIGQGKQPTQVFGSRRKDGSWSSFGADYPNNWRLTVKLNKRHEVTGYGADFRVRVSG